MKIDKLLSYVKSILLIFHEVQLEVQLELELELESKLDDSLLPAVSGVFECKYDNENFNKNVTYFICKITWLHVCSLSILLTSNYWSS